MGFLLGGRVGKYYRTPAMTALAQGRPGEFICYNCGRYLITRIVGPHDITLTCPHCKAEVTLRLREPLEVDTSTTSVRASASDANGSRAATPGSSARWRS